jgi:acyl carrier protein
MKLDEFIEKFADLFDDTDVSEFTAETKFKELEEWSSLEALCVISMASDEFGVQMSAKDLKGCETIADVYNFITSHK